MAVATVALPPSPEAGGAVVAGCMERAWRRSDLAREIYVALLGGRQGLDADVAEAEVVALEARLRAALHPRTVRMRPHAPPLKGVS